MLAPSAPGQLGATAATATGQLRSTRSQTAAAALWPALRFRPPPDPSTSALGGSGSARDPSGGSSSSALNLGVVAGSGGSAGPEESEAWAELARLYEQLGEEDVAEGLMIRHLLRCPGKWYVVRSIVCAPSSVLEILGYPQYLFVFRVGPRGVQVYS